ncbi:LCP family protein [Streptomyces longwoodensis]|uniref:LCP family protein n=1 Tax=Streptomyces longwoodensis TaxID=68231 RepID=UPI0033DAD2BC
MNDRYDAGYGGDQYELVGYDEFGQPVYRPVPPRQDPPQQVPQQQSYDPYVQQPYGYDQHGYPQQGGQGGYDQHGAQGYDQQGYDQQGYGYDPYATGQQPPTRAYDPYDTGRQDPVGPAPYGTAPQSAPAPAYDPYGQGAASGRKPRAESRVAEQTAYIPQQAGPAADEDAQRSQDADAPQREYHTEQFAFVEDPDAESEDVIDWLNFTENRTERREEAKRRARSRLVALVVVLALVAVAGVGYLWYAGKLPGLSSSSDKKSGTTAAPAAQKRDVIAVHLHDTSGGGTATALLVDNTTTRQGTTVLLPNALVLTDDDGTTTTLAKSVDDDGSSGTREALDTVLGTDIQGTWRLDTPYLQNLVDLVGTIEIDTDTDVPDPVAKKKGAPPLVHKGGNQTLSGKMAVAYATYRAEGETPNAQLQRFGQVMQGVLRKISSDAQAATVTVQTLAQILDPSLTDKDLGTFLAKLADLAKGGDYKTAVLPVQADGTLSAEASASVVKDVLGGTAKSPDRDAAVSVSVQNASGRKADTEDARVVLLNGGFTFVEAGTAATDRATSKVLYADAADKENATEVAKTLGLSAGVVAKGTVPGNADVAVVLGEDYEPQSS